jgi:flagellar basal-body rod protein FlgF
MIRGLYTGAAGMVTQMNRMDAVANNLANVDLVGYKRDLTVDKAFPELLLRRMDDDGVKRFPFGSVDISPIIGKLGTGVETNEVYTVFSQGAFKQTGSAFDMALEGKGFLTVRTPDGDRYTRNGSFVLGPEGYLVTKEGFQVLGENGPIKIKANNFVVDQRGRVFENKRFNGNDLRLVSMEENEWDQTGMVDTLKIVDFDQPRYLKKQGSSLWNETPESGEAALAVADVRPKIRQGFLEASNVNPVTEMVLMIEVNRAYEANQKTIQTQDSLLSKLINEAVRV